MSPERHGTAQYFFWQDDGALLGLPSNAVEALCTIAGHTVGGVVALPAQPDPETALAALDSLKRRLTSAGVEVAFSGLTVKDGSNDKRVPTLVVDRITTGRSGDVPAPFRVVALMQVFNEGDVLDATLSWLIRQGVDVWVLDNWSTDASFEIALSHRGRGVINVERFPSDGPQRHCAHRDVLTRKEILSARLDADWFILADADEIRTPPWPGIDLREALFRIGRAGFNAVDYTTVVFRRWTTTSSLARIPSSISGDSSLVPTLQISCASGPGRVAVVQPCSPRRVGTASPSTGEAYSRTSSFSSTT